MHNTYWNPTALTRRALIKALSKPGRSRSDVSAIVDRFIGKSPVPPSWSLRGVRATFGRGVAREWARHLRHRTAGRDPQVRGRLHVVQTIADLGATTDSSEAVQPRDAGGLFMPIDEFNMLAR